MRSSARRRVAALLASLVIVGSGTAGWTAEPTRATVTTYTAFTIDGEAGAYVGGGVPQVYTDADSTFATGDAFNGTTPGYVLLVITGTSDPATGHWYYVHLAAPPGEDLQVGTYTGATRAAFRGPGEPGIDIYGDGRGCNEIAGEFTVHEVSFTGPTLIAFSATFSFTCESLSPRVAGEVRYGSAQSYAGLRQLPADPAALDYGSSTIVGYPSDPRTTQLVNAGSTTINLSAFGISGNHPGDFSRSAQTCGSSLAPGASCTWDTTFAPTASGLRLAQANYTTNTYGFAHGQTLAGNAQAAIPNLQITPGNGKDFGATAIGTASEQPFVVESIGNIPVTMGSRSIIGTDDADFAVASDDCPAELVLSATCTVTVAFEPGTEGAKSAALKIEADSVNAPYELALLGTAVRPQSGVSWSGTSKAGPAYTWSYGSTLARTVRSGSQRLHLAYATDRINGTWARDSGPYAGIYYIRSSAGSTWTTAKRLNPTTQHSVRPTLAASGSRVYVAWVSQTKLFNYSPTAPRVLYVRVNEKHGDGDGWRARVRLSSTSGRVDYPSIAAAGDDVAIAWTDSVKGTIRLAISTDRGVTWKTASVGSTTVAGPSGYIGLPSVAISGGTVVVSWVADPTGTVKVRVSEDHGGSWAASAALGSQSNGYAQVAVRGSRMAVAWTTATDVVVRVRASGAWGAPYIAATVPIDEDGAGFLYGPVIKLQDPDRVAIAWSEQAPGGDTNARLRWTESSDNGGHWYAIQTLAAITSGATVNDAASVLWPSASTRIVSWNGWTPGTIKYRHFLRIGTGSPTTSFAAKVWSPDRTLGGGESALASPFSVDAEGSRFAPLMRRMRPR